MDEKRVLERLMTEERRAAALGWLAREGDSCHVKLCGMYHAEDIAALNAALPDMCGYIFQFPQSHRNVRGAQLKRFIPQVDERIYQTLVVVDQPFQPTAYHLMQLPVDFVQLHGHEDNDYIQALRTRLHIGVIQAFRIREAADVERALASVADMVLLDAGQGSGETFDWSLVESFGARRPFILAGGLTPDNVAGAVRSLHPWGVDMSSGIETNGCKDPAKMAAAVAAVRDLGSDY